MAAGKVYITAGLPVHKDSGQTPTGNGSAFITAGLPKVVEAAATPLAFFPYHVRSNTAYYNSLIGR